MCSKLKSRAVLWNIEPVCSTINSWCYLQIMESLLSNVEGEVCVLFYFHPERSSGIVKCVSTTLQHNHQHASACFIINFISRASLWILVYIHRFLKEHSLVSMRKHAKHRCAIFIRSEICCIYSCIQHCKAKPCIYRCKHLCKVMQSSALHCELPIPLTIMESTALQWSVKWKVMWAEIFSSPFLQVHGIHAQSLSMVSCYLSFYFQSKALEFPELAFECLKSRGLQSGGLQWSAIVYEAYNAFISRAKLWIISAC